MTVRDNTKKIIIEPVDELCNLLDESTSKRIILYGSKGSGKTMVLSNYEERKAYTNRPIIYTKFDPAGLFPTYIINQVIKQSIMMNL